MTDPKKINEIFQDILKQKAVSSPKAPKLHKPIKLTTQYRGKLTTILAGEDLKIYA